MPVSEAETDRINILDTDQGKYIQIKSYGLPMIFWGYLMAILAVILIMAVAIKGPLSSVINGSDSINHAIGLVVLSTLILVPLVLLAFFFYEKVLTKNANELIVTHKIFWIPIASKRLKLKDAHSFTLEHYLDSPNMARMQSIKGMKSFENKGYFELFAILENDKLVRIDRSSQKRELGKLKEFLSKY